MSDVNPAIGIVAHKFDKNLEILIETLIKEFDIFIHFDKKNEKLNKIKIVNIKNNYKDKIFFVENVPVFWGGFSQIEAEYNIISAVYKVRNKYTHFLLISGADFPIKSNNYIKSYLQKHRGYNFIEINQLPVSGWGFNGGLDRIQHYWATNFNNRNLTKLSGRVTNTLQQALKFKRQLPLEKYYGGSNWVNLTIESLEYIVRYCQEYPQFLKSFRHTRAADEIWIQTVLKTNDINKIVNDCLRYTDWSVLPAPKVLGLEDYNNIIKSNALFARKMNSDNLELQYKILESFNKNAV